MLFTLQEKQQSLTYFLFEFFFIFYRSPLFIFLCARIFDDITYQQTQWQPCVFFFIKFINRINSAHETKRKESAIMEII